MYLLVISKNWKLIYIDPKVSRKGSIVYFEYQMLLNVIEFTLKVIRRYSRSSHQRCSIKNAVLQNFATFTGKYMYWSLFLINFVKNRLQHKCFLVNIAKFLRIPTLKNICKRLFFKIFDRESMLSEI